MKTLQLASLIKMKVLYQLLLLSPCWLSSWGLQNVYITPDGNCSTANGTVLEPCCTLNQLGNLSSHLLEPSVALLLLPGTHMLQEHLGIDKFQQVVMSSLTIEDKVEINCLLISQNFTFLNNHSVNISSLRFTSCTLVFSGDVIVNITNSMFENSSHASLEFDCKLNCGRSHVSIENCRFLSNVVGIAAIGEYIKQHGPYLNITNTLFQGNGDGSINGGVVNVSNYAVYVYNSLLIHNTISAVAAYSSTLNLVDTTFSMNHADYGSTIYLYYSRSLNIINCSFVDNTAEENGGAIFTKELVGNCSIKYSRFKGNVAIKAGGAITATKYSYNDDELSISNCLFVNNSAKWGGALHVSGQSMASDINSFTLNKAKEGGAVYINRSSYVSFTYDSFSSNSAELNGGAVYGTFRGMNVTFSSNRALNGGAIYAESDSYHNTLWARNITVANNIARNKGGAIFIFDKVCYQYSLYWCKINLLEATFSNNTASQGQILYGGLLDRCCIDDADGNCLSGIDYFKQNSHLVASKAAITSDPVRVCLCNENSEVDCATRHLTVAKMRGQTINLAVAAVDMVSKAKKGLVKANYVNFVPAFGERGDRQTTSDYCTVLSYHVFTHHNSAVLVLKPGGVCEQSYISRITIDIIITPCSIGFALETDRCVCDPRLSNYITSCDVDALTIHAMKSRAWIHYDEQFLKVHNNCPLDYCEVSSTINLSSQDEKLCVINRSGVICGSCQDNYSIALGGSKCLDCSSSIAYVWLIPVFAVAGIALVALLLVCNMTISHGTLNELIFYANVVSISRLTNFQDCSVHPLLSVFIAWINLDFGVETCFYPGMDTYQKAWLQFVFPLYIWMLVGAIILVSHYSTRAMKIFGKNNIAVLVTLFLLSYTKLFKTIISVFYVTKVLRGSASNTSDPLVPYSVWVYDGNIEYLKGKHLPLFAVALVFLVFLFLPYTLLLTFGQCIRSIRSRNKCVLWCIRSIAFVSIMDAYHAPYTNRHRYWTGFMLLVRCVIFLTFASNFDNYFANMYVALICLASVISVRAVVSKVYKYFGVNILEIIFLLNLTLLFASVLYFQRNDSSDDKVLCTYATASISISLAMFVAILVYHAYVRIKEIKYFMFFKVWLLVKWQFFIHQYKRAKPTDDHELPEANLPEGPTTSYVELREELLEN